MRMLILGKVMTLFFFLVKLTVLEPLSQHSWIHHCSLLVCKLKSLNLHVGS